MEAQLDPFSVRMIFFRIGWMSHYRGITNNDSISRGGKYISRYGFGHEIYNFQSFQNSVYGYVQPPAYKKSNWNDAKINLVRLGAQKDDASISNVLVVWVATAPSGGAFVVGWYENATLYRECQPPPPGSNRHYSDSNCGYYATTCTSDAVILPLDERVFPIQQKVKGGFGQANVWYADNPDEHRQLRLDILNYVKSRALPYSIASKELRHYQPNLLRRKQIEEIAIEKTASYFSTLGYQVRSVEQDNVGWDLEAIFGRRTLKLEVKGLSDNQIAVELTPNEYAASKKHQESYRICVVTNALTDPHLEIFAYSPDTQKWESQTQKILEIQEIIAAKFCACCIFR